MVETSARLLQLLSLFQAQRYWAGAGLADRLEITPRTLRRDVDKLRSLGYPVHSTSGAAGGYQLGAGATLPPLLLDDDEAVAVAVGLRTAAGGTVTGMEEASVRALAKLQQVLPVRLRRRVTALQSFIVPLANMGPRVDSETLSTITAACHDSERLRFRYSNKSGEGTDRDVEPHRLVHTGKRWYLVAWDVMRDDWRTFRLDRIGSRLKTGARFAPREIPGGDFAAYVSSSVSWEHPHRAQVIFHASAEEVGDRIPATAGTLEILDANRCLLRTGACSLDSMCVYLALIGIDFEVLDPPELKERVQWLGERFTAAANALRERVKQDRTRPLARAQTGGK